MEPLTTDQLQQVLTILSVALGLSLVVERLLEMLRHFFETFFRADSPLAAIRTKKTEQVLRAADRALDKFERGIHGVQAEGTPEEDALGEFEENVSLSTVLVTPAGDPDDGIIMKALLLQIFGFAAGIVLADLFDLRLFNAFLEPFGFSLDHLAFGTGSAKSTVALAWKNLDLILTGLFIGGGSKPVHILMRFITKRKITVETEAPEKSEEATKPEIVTPLPEGPVTADADRGEWVDIRYEGGVDRDLLENIHRRRGEPDLIVFHHTAMHSNSGFEDVYRAVKGRGWSTGYHCVITGDAVIHPFCRWDRYGNHAKGHNLRSLGVAFNGNFETATASEGTNADGRYGNRRPPESQLKAGARMVALWSFLYDIRIDFDSTILPHRKLKQTACPGSNFPVEEFRLWIEHFRKMWESSHYAQKAIADFKKKQFLYATKTGIPQEA